MAGKCRKRRAKQVNISKTYDKLLTVIERETNVLMDSSKNDKGELVPLSKEQVLP